jgi:hypothetical protein
LTVLDPELKKRRRAGSWDYPALRPPLHCGLFDSSRVSLRERQWRARNAAQSQGRRAAPLHRTLTEGVTITRRS